MPPIPSTTLPESTLFLFLDGYEFVRKRCDRLDSDIFQTRIMLQKTICMRGKETSLLFYDQDKFQRAGAAPLRLQKTLFGRGGVQGLDGEAHRHRKAMFMSRMSTESINRLTSLTEQEFQAALSRWETRNRIVLFDELREILCRSVCAWAGVPLDESEVEMRTRDFGAMIDDSGAVGPRHWRGRQARERTERWIGSIIEAVRENRFSPSEECALHTVSFHSDLQGQYLPTRVAAVELINFLRPTIAVARFMTFAALALHDHREWQARTANNTSDLEMFVQEVRRYYPFFPFVAARVRSTFEWKGYTFPKGVRVLLDLWGTDHDPRIWETPASFNPERFRTWKDDPYAFIPQGGGDHFSNHRCAGEWITIELLKTAVRFLTTSMDYAVPKQDLRISLSRLPALPKSGFVITTVRRNTS
ncbi:MAG: cytochrome P450 [Desulfovibrionales bacterium]